jgi:hypothetical protein
LVTEVEVILNYNTELLNNLRPRVSKWGNYQCLGDIFLDIVRRALSSRDSIAEIEWCACVCVCVCVCVQCKYLKVYTQCMLFVGYISNFSTD